MAVRDLNRVAETDAGENTVRADSSPAADTGTPSGRQSRPNRLHTDRYGRAKSEKPDTGHPIEVLKGRSTDCQTDYACRWSSNRRCGTYFGNRRSGESTTTDREDIDSSAVDRAGVDPSAVDPSTVDRAGVDPSTVDRAGVDPSTVDRAGVDPSTTDRGGVESDDDVPSPAVGGDDRRLTAVGRGDRRSPAVGTVEPRLSRVYSVQSRPRDIGTDQRESSGQVPIGPSNDRYEREADRIAAASVGSDRRKLAQSISPVRSTNRTAHDSTADLSDPDASTLPDGVGEVISSPGRPLDPPVRRSMERRLGHSFRGVRIHTGAKAARSAAALGASAYTVGSHVVFGRGVFDPTSLVGSYVLSHELVHVIQQLGGAVRVQRVDGSPPFPNDVSNANEQTRSGDRRGTLSIRVRRTDMEMGHSWIAIEDEWCESTDCQAHSSFGFWPDTYDDLLQSGWIPGIVQSPDSADDYQTHEYRIPLTGAEYLLVRNTVQNWMDDTPNFHYVRNNCTTFVRKVAESADKRIPRTYYLASRQPLYMLFETISGQFDSDRRIPLSGLGEAFKSTVTTWIADRPDVLANEIRRRGGAVYEPNDYRLSTYLV